MNASDPAPAAGFILQRDAALADRNTFGVAARAAWLLDIQDAAAIGVALSQPALGGLPRLLLGEGSNVLFAADFAGVVVSLKTLGVEVLKDDAEAVTLRVAAGEPWDDLVRWTLARGWPGLENLILIPGSVGAAPMQNIGAYGVEAGDFIERVEAFDLATGSTVGFTHAECAFGYRDSVFKRHPDRWLITRVTLRLPHAHALRLDYAGLRQELARMGVERPAPIHVADAVINLRTRKLPDPRVIGNAGSFFKNPPVATAIADRLRAEHPDLPCWPLPDGTHKLSAAWLIEACGFKGLREGDAGVSNRHALVLVNHGQATGAALWALARRIQQAVEARFGVRLEPEPRVIAA
jgi:UDP-N-acetylmuramate dehydrogenase